MHQEVIRHNTRNIKTSFPVVPPCELIKNGGCDQTCTNEGEKAVCSCRPVDFTLGEDGKTCVPVHPCDKPDNGGCNQNCSKLEDLEAKCGCRDGYELGEDGKTCKESKSILFIHISFSN